MTTTYDSNYAYTMATQLAQYDTQYSYTRLDRNKTNYTAQQTALNSLSSALSTFQTKLSSLNSSAVRSCRTRPR
jgi:Flagellar hook-associated protein 2 C-terminus.